VSCRPGPGRPGAPGWYGHARRSAGIDRPFRPRARPAERGVPWRSARPAANGQVSAGHAVLRAPASGSPTGTAARQPLKIALSSGAVGYGEPPGRAAHPVT